MWTFLFGFRCPFLVLWVPVNFFCNFSPVPSLFFYFLLFVSYFLFLCLLLSRSISGQSPVQESPVVMVDEMLSQHPHTFSFSEASLRIMITPHFSPRTRLSMAGRMIITEVTANR